MNKKHNYTAPEMEMMEVKIEVNILSNYSSSSPDDATLYDSGTDQAW